MNQEVQAPQAQSRQVGGYELAEEVTGIRRSTLYALVCQRRIPFIRLSPRMVRFRRADLEAWLEQHAVVEARHV